MQSTTSALSAKFFYRKPLLVGEPKPVFGLAPSDPDRPDQESHFKTVKDARGQNHSLSEAGFVLLGHETAVSDFYNDGHVAEIYYPEMQALAQQETGADKVFVMSHITRNEADAALGKRLGAHRLVHNDFTPNFETTIAPVSYTHLTLPTKRIV